MPVKDPVAWVKNVERLYLANDADGVSALYTDDAITIFGSRVLSPAEVHAHPKEWFDSLLEYELTRTFRAAGSATTPPPAGSMPPPAASTPPDAAGAARASDDERWRSLAEQISMQVLQRLDLFIDTGLKEQLAAHLEPIVARAGAELVETINEHVGQLVRSYIAEAIEREIAQWRQDQP